MNNNDTELMREVAAYLAAKDFVPLIGYAPTFYIGKNMFVMQTKYFGSMTEIITHFEKTNHKYVALYEVYECPENLGVHGSYNPYRIVVRFATAESI